MHPCFHHPRERHFAHLSLQDARRGKLVLLLSPCSSWPCSHLSTLPHHWRAKQPVRLLLRNHHPARMFFLVATTKVGDLFVALFNACQYEYAHALFVQQDALTCQQCVPSSYCKFLDRFAKFRRRQIAMNADIFETHIDAHVFATKGTGVKNASGR